MLALHEAGRAAMDMGELTELIEVTARRTDFKVSL
jgi:hypothetical protein